MAFSRLLFLKKSLPRLSAQHRLKSTYNKSSCLNLALPAQVTSQRLISTNHAHFSNYQRQRINDDPAAFKPKRAVVVSKMSRFEFEKRRYTDHSEDGEISEKRLRKVLAIRGSDYDRLNKRHAIHTENLNRVITVLESFGIEVDLVQRQDYTAERVCDADMIVAAGGDGTFLMAASKVLDDKPILGVNTDPERSEGYLCLPNRYMLGFVNAMEAITTGKFKWKWRQRIRATIECGLINTDPIDLHEEELSFPDHRALHQQQHLVTSYGDIDAGPRVLPVRALNEVFLGESLSSRVSYYEISIDGGPMDKQKSSGITMCTGTGSTSWTYNINKLPQQSVHELLKIVNQKTGSDIPIDDDMVNNIASEFNDRVIFDASEPTMVYTIRDPVVNGIFPQHWLPRGFARRIMIRSRCFDACLVMDGGSSFLFNDGAIATLETRPEDALRTFELSELS